MRQFKLKDPNDYGHPTLTSYIEHWGSDKAPLQGLPLRIIEGPWRSPKIYNDPSDAITLYTKKHMKHIEDIVNQGLAAEGAPFKIRVTGNMIDSFMAMEIDDTDYTGEEDTDILNI